MNQPIVIPVASGKGGVGKSFFSVNLAAELSKTHRVVLVDLDFGGSNLHQYLGGSSETAGVGKFLTSKIPLTAVLQSTVSPNFNFIAGDGSAKMVADVGAARRHALVSEIRQLEADFVILDLSAGSSMATLSMFDASTRGIILSTLDPLALSNSLVFLQNYMYRRMSQIAYQDQAGFPELLQLFKESAESSEKSRVSVILQQVATQSPELYKKLQSEVATIQPRYIFNMVDSAEDARLIPSLLATASHGLDLEPICFGVVPFDMTVRQAVKRQELIIKTAPASAAGQAIVRIANRVRQSWNSTLQAKPAAQGLLSLIPKLFPAQ